VNLSSSLHASEEYHQSQTLLNDHIHEKLDVHTEQHAWLLGGVTIALLNTVPVGHAEYGWLELSTTLVSLHVGCSIQAQREWSRFSNNSKLYDRSISMTIKVPFSSRSCVAMTQLNTSHNTNWAAGSETSEKENTHKGFLLFQRHAAQHLQKDPTKSKRQSRWNRLADMCASCCLPSR
jgi:hypothetical protein